MGVLIFGKILNERTLGFVCKQRFLQAHTAAGNGSAINSKRRLFRARSVNGSSQKLSFLILRNVFVNGYFVVFVIVIAHEKCRYKNLFKNTQN